MFYIREIAIEMIRELRGPLVRIEAADRDLGRQLRRAAASVVLNIGEGAGSSGGTRRERYRTALGSLSEVTACLSVAEAFGYLSSPTDEVLSRARRVGKGLRKMT